MNKTLVPTIHVIDDETSVRTALSRLLKASGYRVALYESGEQFLNAADMEAPGCILLDFNMPGISGLQLQEQLAQHRTDLPIIFLTGNGTAEIRDRALHNGACGFLSKPVEKDDLLQAIQQAIASVPMYGGPVS